jgi:hypothetical protein
MQVPAEVVEDCLPIRGGETIPRRFVKVEGLDRLVDALVGPAVEIDPQQLRALQPLRALRKAAEMLDLIAVEEDRAVPGHGRFNGERL